MMTEEEILRLLEEQYQEAGIYFQVFLQVPYLYIYINREVNYDLEHQQLTEKIVDTILTALRKRHTTHHILALEGISFHSRIFGTVKPDWETYLELPTLAIDTDEIEHESLPEVNLGETSELTQAQEIVEEPAAKPFELSSYCFIRNRSLLTSKLPPPPVNIAKLVDFFHILPNQQIVVPFLEDIFNKTQIPNTEHHLESIQKWVKEIIELDAAHKRKASIWFSRYCFNPTATIEELQGILSLALEETPTPTTTEKTELQPTEETEPSLLKPSRVKSSTSTEKLQTPTVTTSRLKKASKQKNPTWQPSSIQLAIAWIIFTGFAIMINFRTMSAALETSPLCANSPASEQCELAVQMVGAPGIELASKSHPGVPSERTKAAAFFEGVTADVYTIPYGLSESANRTCSFYGTIKAGMKFKEVVKMMPNPISIEGKIILPGVYFVDVLQHNFQGGSEPIRTDCVFRYQETQQKVNVETLAIEVIPTKWPEEPYEKTSQPVAIQKATGLFSMLSIFGTGTLFTAIGIFVAIVLGLGIRANSLDTIFKASFFLGIIETLLSFLPIFFVAKIALETLALGLTSAVVKDFKVEWSSGYPLVAAGAIVIISLRMLLNWIVFGLLLAWLS